MDFNYWNAKFAALPGTVQKKDHTKTFYYKEGKTVAHVNGAGTVVILDINAFGAEEDSLIIDKQFLDSTGFVKEAILDRDSLVASRRDAVEKRNAFFEEFKAAVFEDCNVALDHPKAEKLWELAMDNVRGEGLQALYNEVSELSELLS